MNTNISSLEVGKVYRAKLIKTADVPNEKIIATMFLIESTGAHPVQIYSYKGRWPKETVLTWYKGKYKTDFKHRQELIDTYWYIWRCPDKPDFIEVIKRSDGLPSEGGDTDEWGFPIDMPDDALPF